MNMDIRAQHFESTSYAPRARTRLISSETLPGVIKAIDFVTALICAGAAYIFSFLAIVGHQERGSIGSHSITAVFGVILFIPSFERIRGYKFEQLPRLRWQLT